MQLFPVRRYEIKSLAKPSEIAAILSAHVEPYSLFPGKGRHKAFSGSVSETGFRFVHIGASGKTFPFHPTISGRFIPSAQRTTIRITIKHDAFFFIPVAVISVLFCLISLPMVGVLLFAGHFSNTQIVQMILPLLCLLFLSVPAISYLSALSFFQGEVISAGHQLANIFDPILLKPDNSSR